MGADDHIISSGMALRYLHDMDSQRERALPLTTQEKIDLLLKMIEIFNFTKEEVVEILRVGDV